MVDQLSLVPEGLTPQPDGSYQLYSGQIFHLSVTLTLAQGTIGDQTYVLISPLGPGEQLQPYGNIEGSSFHQQDELTVKLKIEPTDDPGVGTARLQVLALGRLNEKNVVTAVLFGDDQITGTMTSVQKQPYSSVPVVVDGFYLPTAAATDAWTPSTVQGRFVHYRFAVADMDTHAPLERILVRLTAVPANAAALDVALYDSYDATEPLQNQSQDQSPNDRWYVDLQTDADGMAEVYLCAKPSGRPTAGQLQAKIGVATASAGPFLVADLSAMDANLPPPYIVSNPVHVDAQTESVPVRIDAYEKPAAGDTIYLFCNRVYQQQGTIGDPATWFNNQELSINSYNLHSLSFDDATPNELQFCVLRTTGEVRVSSVHYFSVTGTPPTPVPELPVGDGPAPELEEPIEHGIVNCHTLAGGVLHVRVVFGAGGLREISPDVDTLKLKLYLSGFRADSNAPKGAVMEGPEEFVILQADIDRGYVGFWFRAQLFLGYGRKKSNAQAGAFQAQYVVAAPNNRSIKVRSRPLDVGLDTIAPGDTGAEDGPRRSISAARTKTRHTA